MKKRRKIGIGLVVVLIVLGLTAWKAYPYVVVGVDYLNGEGLTEIGDGSDLGETIMAQIESGKIQSDPEIVKALSSISADFAKVETSLALEDQKRVVALAQQAINSIINNKGNYEEKLNDLAEAYSSLSSEQKQEVQLSIVKNINMRDFLTLKKKLEKI